MQGHCLVIWNNIGITVIMTWRERSIMVHDVKVVFFVVVFFPVLMEKYWSLEFLLILLGLV